MPRSAVPKNANLGNFVTNSSNRIPPPRRAATLIAIIFVSLTIVSTELSIYESREYRFTSSRSASRYELAIGVNSLFDITEFVSIAFKPGSEVVVVLTLGFPISYFTTP